MNKVRLIFRRSHRLCNGRFVKGGYEIRMFDNLETAADYLARPENLQRLFDIKDLSRKESRIFNSKVTSLLYKRGLVESK